MTEQSANSQDSGRFGWQPTPSTANVVPIGTIQTRIIGNVCPECGERVQGQLDSCPACGENLAHTPKHIRCMHCHITASSELVVCPGCGRELREAPPKLVTRGVPAILALLFVVILATQWARISPIAWARTNLVRGLGMVEGISASIEPEMVIVMTPIVQNAAVPAGAGAASAVLAENAAASDIQSDTQSVAMLSAESVVTPVPNANGGARDDTSILAAAVAKESPIGVGGPQPTEDSTALSRAAEALATATLPATDTPVPTDTPLPPTTEPATTEPTAVNEPTVAKASGMAATFGSTEPINTPTPTWTALAAQINAQRNAVPVTPTGEAVAGMAQVAPLTASDTALPTPTATPTVATTPLPTPTSTPVVYQVRSGDTLVTIAATYGVDVEALMAANEISGQDVYGIQPGQMLFVPIPTSEPSLATEPVVSVASASSDLSVMRLEAPALLVPTNEASVGCATGGKMIWDGVQFIKDSDKYVLHLGFINGEPINGQESVFWVLAQNAPVTVTEWELDTSLCELAPADYDRQWRWWVEVVEEADGQTVSVSPPSEIRSFIWK